MKVLIVSETLTAGGAETFALRLCSKLQEKGIDASLYVFYKDKINPKLLAQFNSLAPITPNIPFIKFFSKIDSLFLKLKVDFSIIELIIQWHLNTIIKNKKITTIHSNLFKTDHVIYKCIRYKKDINFITTIHGDYTQYALKLSQGVNFRILNFTDKAINICKRLNKIVCITDTHMEFFKSFIKENYTINGCETKIEKIYNGYYINKTNDPIKKSFSINDGFVFGMVSRGLREKGWEYAIKAFISLNAHNTFLILVGESDYLSQLKEKYKSNDNIKFAGFSANPIEWIETFHVGMLPSYIPTESLPTVIIEYLALNKPVICTDIGECKAMITSNKEMAGDVINIEAFGLIDETKLCAIMKRFLDLSYYQNKKANTTNAFQKFNMDNCINQYLELYK